MRKLDGNRRVVLSPHVFLFELNSLIGQRTHFFAHNTIFMVRPGNTAAFVNIGFADDLSLFLLETQRRNSLDGANLPARVAGEFAVTVAGDKDR
jgi:hypothetical protein